MFSIFIYILHKHLNFSGIWFVNNLIVMFGAFFINKYSSCNILAFLGGVAYLHFRKAITAGDVRQLHGPP